MVVLVVLAMGLLIVRLWQGPLSLDFLTTRFVDGFEPDDGSYHMSIGATELIWAGGWRGIDLIVRTVDFTDATGAGIASFPNISVELSVPALLQGEIAPSRIELMSPDIRLVREPDGSVGLGLGKGTQETGGSSILESFVSRNEDEQAPAAASSLRYIIVHGGRLALIDRQSDFETHAYDVEADVQRDGASSFTIDLSASLALGPDRVPFRMHAARPEPTALTEVSISLADLVLPEISSAAAPLIATTEPPVPAVAEAAARLGMPLDLNVDLALAEGTPQNIRVRASGKQGTLGLAPFLPVPISIEEVTLDSSYDATSARAALELSLDLGASELKVSGTWERSSGALAVNLSSKHLPVSKLGGYWPADAAATARNWIVTNITTGDVSDASADLGGVLTLEDQPSFMVKSIDGRLEFVGLSVRYVDTMSPATGVTGSATFSMDGWSFAVRSAKVAGLDVTGAAVNITGLEAPISRIKIDAQTRGSLRDALLLVDQKPLGYAHKLGIEPGGATGAITGKLLLDFPLSGAPIPSDLGAIVQVDLQKAALPRIVSDYPLSDGNLHLDVRASKLALSGSAKLAGAPCTVQWSEQLGSTSGVTRTVDVNGTVGTEQRAALGLDLRPWLTGPAEVTAHLEQKADGVGTAKVKVDLTPAVIAVPEFRLSKPAGAPGQATGRLTLSHAHIVAIDGFHFAAATAHAEGNAKIADGHFTAIDLDGELPAASLGGEQPDFALTVTPAGGSSTVELTSQDASGLLKLLAPDATTSGGQLRFTGRTSHESEGFDVAGSLLVESFTLTHSSLLARLATLGSLDGIVSALRQEGIAFEKLSSELQYAGGTANIQKAHLKGKSLQLLFSGTIDGANDQVSLDGTLVPPVYGLNALPGKIPLIGGLFRQEGGGMFGIDFSVDGNLNDPKLSVKPLASLTPGALKSLTSGSR